MAAVYRELTATAAVPSKNTTEDTKHELNRSNIG